MGTTVTYRILDDAKLIFKNGDQKSKIKINQFVKIISSDLDRTKEQDQLSNLDLWDQDQWSLYSSAQKLSCIRCTCDCGNIKISCFQATHCIWCILLFIPQKLSCIWCTLLYVPQKPCCILCTLLYVLQKPSSIWCTLLYVPQKLSCTIAENAGLTKGRILVSSLKRVFRNCSYNQYWDKQKDQINPHRSKIAYFPPNLATHLSFHLQHRSHERGFTVDGSEALWLKAEKSYKIGQQEIT